VEVRVLLRMTPRSDVGVDNRGLVRIVEDKTLDRYAQAVLELEYVVVAEAEIVGAP
jgi:hypothetical protein